MENINTDDNSQIEFNFKYPKIAELFCSNDENSNLLLNHLFLLEIRRA